MVDGLIRLYQITIYNCLSDIKDKREEVIEREEREGLREKFKIKVEKGNMRRKEGGQKRIRL